MSYVYNYFIFFTEFTITAIHTRDLLVIKRTKRVFLLCSRSGDKGGCGWQCCTV